MTALVILLAVVVGVLVVLVVGLLRSHAEVLRRLHELGAGVWEDEGVERQAHPAPPPTGPIRTRPGVPEPRAETTAARDLTGTTPDGAARSVTVMGAPQDTLLAFLSSGCGTCAQFWSAFAAQGSDLLPGRDMRLVVVTKGPDSESPAAVRALASPSYTTLMSSEAFEHYGVSASPYFVLVERGTGAVAGEGAAASWPQVRNLLSQAVADVGSLGREARADADLRAAGIVPGHPSLYPTTLPGSEEQ